MGLAKPLHPKASLLQRNKAAVWPLLLILVTLFFFRNVAGGMPAIPFGMLYQYSPWQAQSPSTQPPVHNPELSDQLFQFYPWGKLAMEELKNGRFPLWNPYSFCGSPLFANGQSGILFPLNFLNLIFGQVKASILIECLRIFIAAVFTWAFLRRLGTGPTAAVFGAVVFAFSRNMIVWLGFPAANAAILMPALFWAFEGLIERPSVLYALTGAILVALQFLAGQPQTSLVCFFGVSLYLLFRLSARSNSYRSRIKVSGFYAFSWFSGALLAAVQILPLVDYMRESAAFAFRSHFNLKAYPWYELVSFIVPDFFGTPYQGNYWGFANLVGTACYLGVVPLILALMSLPRALSGIKLGSFWAVALICLGIVYRVPVIDSILSLPLFNSIDTNKFLVLIVFSLTVCSALELDCIVRGEERRILTKGAVAAAVLILFAIFTHAALNNFVSALKLQFYEAKNFEILLSFAVLGLAALYLHRRKVLGKEVLCWVFLVLSYADLYWFGHAFNAAAPQDKPPRTPSAIMNLPADVSRYRVLGVRDTLPPNTSVLYGLADARGYDAMTPRRYFEFLSHSQPAYADFLATLPEATVSPVTRSALFLRDLRRMLAIPGGGLAGMLQKAYYWNTNLDGLIGSNTLGLFSVKYVLAPPGTTELPGGRLKLIAGDGASVFENPESLPRCFLRHSFEITDERSALQTAARQDFDFKNRLLLSGVADAEALSSLATGQKADGQEGENAEIVRQNPSSVEIAVNTGAPAIVVLNDLFSAGWEAYVDDQRVEIYQANYLFRAIALRQAGRHRILFSYRPRSFKLGVAITLGAVVLFCAAMFGLPAFSRIRQDLAASHRGKQ